MILWKVIYTITLIKTNTSLLLLNMFVMRKPVFLQMQKQRRRSAADQHLCLSYIDSTVPLLSKSVISSLMYSPVCVEPG